MEDLSFEIELRWSGTGREGAGEIQIDDGYARALRPRVDGRSRGRHQP